MKTPQQVIIIHGGTTYKNHEEYFLALKNLNIKLDRMKSSRDWKDGLQEKLGDNFVVYTPQMPNKQNAQYEEWKILFEKVLNLLDEGLVNESLCSFVREGDLSNFEKQAGKIYLYHSQDDMVVPYDHVEKYAKELSSATVREFKDRGHFKQEEVLELVEDVMREVLIKSIS